MRWCGSTPSAQCRSCRRTASPGGPPLVDGHGDWWLPEEVLVASAASSLYNRCRDVAADEHVALGAFHCIGEAIFHRDRGKTLARLVLRVEMEAPAADIVKHENVLRRAKATCPIAHALDVPVEVQLTIVPIGARRASTVERTL